MIVLYGWILWFPFLQKKVNFVLLEGIQNTDIISRCSVNPLHGQVHFGGVVNTGLDFRLTLGFGLVETVHSPLFFRKIVEIKRLTLLSGLPSWMSVKSS